jgi:peptide/nickel transport system substrate-binding protein
MKKRIQRKGIFLGLTLFIVVLMLFVACSNAAKTPAKTTALTSVPTTSVPSTSAPTPKYKGTLKFGINQDYDQIGDPSSLQTIFPPTADISLEGLLIFNHAGEVIPWLATGYKYDTSAPSLTLNLRQGVKFHDGTDFNATAVKWNLDKDLLVNATGMDSVKTVEIIDDHTVRLNLSRQDTLITTKIAANPFGLIMSPTAYDKAGSTDEARSRWAKSNPVGTGPFKFVKWERDVKISFAKNDNYWQKGKPYLDGIEFTIIVNEATLLASFKAGELDVMYTENPENLSQLDQSGQYTMQEGEVNFVGGLEPDSLNPDSPWANIKVRQAAAYSVDNAALAKRAGAGYYMATNQFEAPGRWCYNPNVKGYPYDTAKAKALLAEAGYPNGFDTTINGMAPFEGLVTIFQGYLAEVGIKAKANLLPPPAMIQMYNNGWTGVNMCQFGCVPNATFIFSTFFSAAGQPNALHSLYVPPEWQQLLDKMMAEPDFEKQKALIWQLQSDFIDKYLIMSFSFAQKMPLPMQKYVHDIKTDVSMHWTPGNAWKDK